MQDAAQSENNASSAEAIILGTSNSILRGGWVDGLRDTSPVAVRNLSAGASASALALWQLADSGLPSDDTARLYMLDTLVNDETFINARRYDFGWWHYYQSHLMQVLPAQQTIFVGFSSQKFFSKPSLQAILQEQMCEKYGLHFISLRRILLSAKRRSSQKRESINGDDVFEDPGHFHRHLARIFGYWLGQYLPKIVPQPKVQQAVEAMPFEALVPGEHNGVPEERRTSLRVQQTIFFELGQSFQLDGARLLHGVCIDASNTRCILNIDTGDENSVSIELGYNVVSERMQTKFVHFPAPLRVGPGGAKVTISAAPDFKLVTGIHSRRKDGDFHGMRLLSFLSGPAVDDPAVPEVELPDAANKMTEIEKVCFKNSSLIDTLVDPPEVPNYPRSFIEL